MSRKIEHDARQIAGRICELYTREDGWGLPSEPEAIAAAIQDATPEQLDVYQAAIEAQRGPGLARTVPVVAEEASAA